MDHSNCPICNQLRYTTQRYPNKICNNCSKLCVTKEGKLIQFFNIDNSGGFVSIVDNKERGEIHECYVNNIKCYADEARFGGIVISKIIQ